jgi:cytochrome c553
LIAKVAIDAASLLPNSTPVAVIAEDTDVLALFLHHRQPGMRDILFVSEPKKVRGAKTSAGKCISVNELQQKIGLDSCSRILAVHAFGGCDSTSAIFGLGKGTVFAKINKDTSLHSHCTTLQSHTASPDAVCEAGVKLMVGICGTNSRESLSDLRYSAFCNTSLSRKFMPERLPPSEDATKLHAKRAHLQAVIWVTLGNSNLVPTDWGWSLSQGRLKPTALDGPVAPDNVLNVVRCKCKDNCSSALCSCRKHGLTCVTACSNCHGAQCTNIQAQEVPSSFDDSDSEPECSAGEPSCEDLGQFFVDTNFHLHQLYKEEI